MSSKILLQEGLIIAFGHIKGSSAATEMKEKAKIIRESIFLLFLFSMCFHSVGMLRSRKMAM